MARRMTPSWRKPVGVLAILAYALAWAVLVASFSHHVGGWPDVLQLGFYIVAGLVWILPLKPALRWMETGRWR
jgi:hypothetical protein